MLRFQKRGFMSTLSPFKASLFTFWLCLQAAIYYASNNLPTTVYILDFIYLNGERLHLFCHMLYHWLIDNKVFYES